jgi:hypothetical protein
MRSDLLVAAALVCAGCTSAADSTPSGGAPEQAEKLASPEAPEAPVAAADGQPSDSTADARVPAGAGDSAKSVVKAGKMWESLGEAAAVVGSATDVQIARLRVIAALHAELGRLKGDTSITGYPIEGASKQLDEATQEQLLDILFDDANYQWGLARRCRNEYRVGLRFTTAAAKVEFSLGMPCEQSFFVFMEGDEVKTTGQVMTTEAAQRIIDMASAAGVL